MSATTARGAPGNENAMYKSKHATRNEHSIQHFLFQIVCNFSRPASTTKHF
ncbi:hypothetical protein [Longitalea luteola]|uniref:hypothetical protein n=1 Tax=Longitalea luteola TaxID=2812563 RepID=UPI001A968FB3|nr:hypothetical protein [Longitalea luteola]